MAICSKSRYGDKFGKGVSSEVTQAWLRGFVAASKLSIMQLQKWLHSRVQAGLS
jgi:hypothetical protein